MSKVDEMIADIIKKEGGYVNHKADKGGPTNWGVTQATLSAYIERPASIADVRALKKETAATIYKQNYFLKPRLNQLPEAVQHKVFDISVNSGPSRAVKILQRTLTDLGYEVGGVDGVLGLKTIGATESCLESKGEAFLLNALVDARIAFYRSIVANNPSQKVFLAGWENRANSFRVA
jgi:lysozyme family protein